MVGGEGCPPPGDPDRFYGDPPIGGDGKFGPTREREVREGVEWIMGVDERKYHFEFPDVEPSCRTLTGQGG